MVRKHTLNNINSLTFIETWFTSQYISFFFLSVLCVPTKNVSSVVIDVMSILGRKFCAPSQILEYSCLFLFVSDPPELVALLALGWNSVPFQFTKVNDSHPSTSEKIWKSENLIFCQHRMESKGVCMYSLSRSYVKIRPRCRMSNILIFGIEILGGQSEN